METFLQDTDALVANIQREIDQIRNFQMDPHWKTRVINVPQAVDQIRDFVTSVPQEIHDKITSLRDDLRSLFGLFEHQPPGTESGMSGATKLIGWVSLIDQSFELLENFVTDFSVVVDDIRQIREQLETFDALFLPQGSTKTTVDIKYRKRNA